MAHNKRENAKLSGTAASSPPQASQENKKRHLIANETIIVDHPIVNLSETSKIRMQSPETLHQAIQAKRTRSHSPIKSSTLKLTAAKTPLESTSAMSDTETATKQHGGGNIPAGQTPTRAWTHSRRDRLREWARRLPDTLSGLLNNDGGLALARPDQLGQVCELRKIFAKVVDHFTTDVEYVFAKADAEL